MMTLPLLAHGCKSADLPRKAACAVPTSRCTCTRRCAIARCYNPPGVAEKSDVATLQVGLNSHDDAHVAGPHGRSRAPAFDSPSASPRRTSSLRGAEEDEPIAHVAVLAGEPSVASRLTDAESSDRSSRDAATARHQDLASRDHVPEPAINGSSRGANHASNGAATAVPAPPRIPPPSDDAGLDRFFTNLLSELSIASASAGQNAKPSLSSLHPEAGTSTASSLASNATSADMQETVTANQAQKATPATSARIEHSERGGAIGQPYHAPSGASGSTDDQTAVANRVQAASNIAPSNGSLKRSSSNEAGVACTHALSPSGTAEAEGAGRAASTHSGQAATAPAHTDADALEEWARLRRIEGAILPDSILFGGSEVQSAAPPTRRPRARSSPIRNQRKSERTGGPARQGVTGLKNRDRRRHSSSRSAVIVRGDRTQGRESRPHDLLDAASSSSRPEDMRGAQGGEQPSSMGGGERARRTRAQASSVDAAVPPLHGRRHAKLKETRTLWGGASTSSRGDWRGDKPAAADGGGKLAGSTWSSDVLSREAQPHAGISWEDDLERYWAAESEAAGKQEQDSAAKSAARTSADASTSGRAPSDRGQRELRGRRTANSNNNTPRRAAAAPAVAAAGPSLDSKDAWLGRPLPEDEVARRLAASGDWDLTRFLSVSRAMANKRLWPQLLLTARHAASQPSFLHSLRRDAAAECALLNQLDLLASAPKGAPSVLALLDPLLHTKAEARPRLPLRVRNLAIKAATTAGDVAAAEAVFRGIRRAGLHANVVTFGMMISAYGGAARWRDAVDLLRLMRVQGVEPNVITYTALIKACTSAGASDAAVEVFHSMDAVGVKADLQAYNALMAVFAKEPDWEKCWSVLAAMRRAGIPPDIVSYNTILVACERSGQWPRVHEMFARMERASEASPELAPNQVTYNTVMAAAGRAGEWQQALEIHARMRSAGIAPDKVTMSTLISALDSAGQWQLALETFESMVQQGVKPNPHCFNATISALARGSQASEAKAMVQRMRDAGYVPDIFTYAPLIEALGKAGLCREALQVYADMQEAGVQPNSYVYTALLNACERDNNWPEAVKLFYAMKDSGVEVNTLSMAARHILYLWPQLMDTMPQPIITAARVAVDSGRAARDTVDRLLRNIPQTL